MVCVYHENRLTNKNYTNYSNVHVHTHTHTQWWYWIKSPDVWHSKVPLSSVHGSFVNWMCLVLILYLSYWEPLSKIIQLTPITIKEAIKNMLYYTHTRMMVIFHHHASSCIYTCMHHESQPAHSIKARHNTHDQSWQLKFNIKTAVYTLQKLSPMQLYRESSVSVLSAVFIKYQLLLVLASTSSFEHTSSHNSPHDNKR